MSLCHVYRPGRAPGAKGPGQRGPVGKQKPVFMLCWWGELMEERLIGKEQHWCGSQEELVLHVIRCELLSLHS
ncbi:hypothetical protein JZ751_026081 [Albula glossodonta]|uniref:Uncharacterized protein n=1 Tax=Albula glossodonta TaxID=121402 RepID=A0A8T2NES4_9TELE|nr:hypothetical protein JZ751_026081 [Albula glossodonta]